MDRDSVSPYGQGASKEAPVGPRAAPADPARRRGGGRDLLRDAVAERSPQRARSRYTASAIAPRTARTASVTRAILVQSFGDAPNTTSGRCPCTIARYGAPRKRDASTAPAS